MCGIARKGCEKVKDLIRKEADLIPWYPRFSHSIRFFHHQGIRIVPHEANAVLNGPFELSAASPGNSSTGGVTRAILGAFDDVYVVVKDLFKYYKNYNISALAIINQKLVLLLTSDIQPRKPITSSKNSAVKSPTPPRNVPKWILRAARSPGSCLRIMYPSTCKVILFSNLCTATSCHSKSLSFCFLGDRSCNRNRCNCAHM